MSGTLRILLLVVLAGAVPTASASSAPQPPCVFEAEGASARTHHDRSPPMAGPVSDWLGVSVDVQRLPRRPSDWPPEQVSSDHEVVRTGQVPYEPPNAHVPENLRGESGDASCPGEDPCGP